MKPKENIVYKISEILIEETKRLMDYHKRSASGEAVNSLQEVVLKNGTVINEIQIVGIDYFKDIFNGIPAGRSVTISTLQDWVKNRNKRYGAEHQGVASPSVVKNIAAGNAWINKQEEKLHIDSQVLVNKQLELDTEVETLTTNQIEQWT